MSDNNNGKAGMVHVRGHTREGHNVNAYERAYPGGVNHASEQNVGGYLDWAFQNPASIIDLVKDGMNDYGRFRKMKGVNDKYKHASTNCRAAQKGLIGSAAIDFISTVIEAFDIAIKDGSLKDRIQDSLEDMEANTYGISVGMKHPKGDCDEMVKERYPKQRK